jgi:hypothetical protein
MNGLEDLEAEFGFRNWYLPMAQRLGISPNPDDPEHHYDYRALYRDSGQQPDKAGDHFPSIYKTEGHPRAYLDDGRGRVFDTRKAQYLTGEPVPQDRLTASEQSPDMPGFDPEKTRRVVEALYGAGPWRR